MKVDPLLQDDPLEDFGVEVSINPLPIPPKPKSSKKPSITAGVNPSYTSIRYQGPHKPVSGKGPPAQGQVQQPGRSPSPVYESL